MRGWSERNEGSKGFHLSCEGSKQIQLLSAQVFWDAVTLLISKGYTSDTAIDRIYLVYGEGKSVG